MKIRNTVLAAAVAASALLVMGGGVANADEIVPCGSDSECARLNPGVYGYGVDAPFGEYEVPGGLLRVHADGSAEFEPYDNVILGVCERDDTNATTGEWHEPNYGCVPMYAPDGKTATRAFADDGSGSYDGSAWAFDAESKTFVPASKCWDEPKPAPLPTERICGNPALAPADAINFSA